MFLLLLFFLLPLSAHIIVHRRSIDIRLSRCSSYKMPVMRLVNASTQTCRQTVFLSILNSSSSSSIIISSRSSWLNRFAPADGTGKGHHGDESCSFAFCLHYSLSNYLLYSCKSLSVAFFTSHSICSLLFLLLWMAGFY